MHDELIKLSGTLSTKVYNLVNEIGPTTSILVFTWKEKKQVCWAQNHETNWYIDKTPLGEAYFINHSVDLLSNVGKPLPVGDFLLPLRKTRWTHKNNENPTDWSAWSQFQLKKNLYYLKYLISHHLLMISLPNEYPLPVGGFLLWN